MWAFGEILHIHWNVGITFSQSKTAYAEKVKLARKLEFH